jgi:uncharacterized membrane protein YdjX (TVP38/TMEM64 family)
VQLGPWGYVAFILAYTSLHPFGVPGTLFVVAAALIWPWPIAFVLSMVGTMAASCVRFSFSRFVARDWIVGIIPARFKKYDEALERRAFTTVFLLRLIFWMPPLLHAFFGVSKVRFWTHFWGSSGLAPTTRSAALSADACVDELDQPSALVSWRHCRGPRQRIRTLAPIGAPLALQLPHT